MKSLIFLGFLIMSCNCELTRHSDDVLKRGKIFIEGHRGVSNGQKNHNTKEAILDAIDNGIEAIEIDAWLTTDKKVVVFYDLSIEIYDCNNILINARFNKLSKICDLSFSELQKCYKRRK